MHCSTLSERAKTSVANSSEAAIRSSVEPWASAFTSSVTGRTIGDAFSATHCATSTASGCGPAL